MHLITHIAMHSYSHTGASDTLEYSHQDAQLLTQVLVMRLSTHIKVHCYSHAGASDALDYSHQDAQLLTHRC